MVEVARFELATFYVQGRRSANWSYTPMLVSQPLLGNRDLEFIYRTKSQTEEWEKLIKLSGGPTCGLWSKRRDLNSRPLRWQRNVLPLNYFCILRVIFLHILLVLLFIMNYFVTIGDFQKITFFTFYIYYIIIFYKKQIKYGV